MGLTLTACTNSETQKLKDSEEMNTTLQLTQEWDKVFPKSDKVDHKKVTFKNRYGIELAADMYIPISGLGDSSSSRLGTSPNDQTTNSQTTKGQKGLNDNLTTCHNPAFGHNGSQVITAAIDEAK